MKQSRIAVAGYPACRGACAWIKVNCCLNEVDSITMTDEAQIAGFSAYTEKSW